MDSIKPFLQSTTNRLVASIVAVHVIVTAIFAGAPTGLELYPYSSESFRYWQVVSSIFLHSGWWHLGFNMLALWSFGRVLEQVWGGQRLFQFFLACGIGAGIMHLAVTEFQLSQLASTLTQAGMTSADLAKVTRDGLDVSAQFEAVSSKQLYQLFALSNVPAVGASGAVYGILVAFALLFPNFKVMLVLLPIPIAAKFFVPVLLLIDLSAGITGVSIFGANIAHFAHLGGALVGFLLVYWWQRGGATPSR
jgi:membrane associated rhomboid family serine protease